MQNYIVYLKGEFFDFVYLQQNAYDQVDEATTKERQKYIFDFIYNNILEAEFNLQDKEKALHFFRRLRQQLRGWNSAPWKSGEFAEIEKEISAILKEEKSA